MFLVPKTRTQQPGLSRASLLAQSLGLSRLWNFNGAVLPPDSLTGQQLLTDPAGVARSVVSPGGYGLQISPPAVYNRILVTRNPFNFASITYIFAVSISNTADSGIRYLTTTKNLGGTSQSSFENQFGICVTGTRNISFVHSTTTGGTISGVLKFGPNTFIVVNDVPNNLRTTIVGGRVVAQTSAYTHGSQYSTNGIGYSRYVAGPLGVAISLNALGVIPACLDIEVAKDLSRHVWDLFEYPTYRLPPYLGAPTITALSAINITANSAQPRVSYSHS